MRDPHNMLHERASTSSWEPSDELLKREVLDLVLGKELDVRTVAVTTAF